MPRERPAPSVRKYPGLCHNAFVPRSIITLKLYFPSLGALRYKLDIISVEDGSSRVLIMFIILVEYDAHLLTLQHRAYNRMRMCACW